MKEDLVIFGASGHGRAALDAALTMNKFKFKGWIDNSLPHNALVQGKPVLGGSDILKKLLEKKGDSLKIFFAVSNNYNRMLLFNEFCKDFGEDIITTIIHKNSSISSLSIISKGSLIMSNVSINNDCKIGKAVIINTSSSIDHDNDIEDFSSVLPGSITGGNVKIGECSCICMGSIVSHNVTIGSHSYIGAGSLVLKDVSEYSYGFGIPFNKMRNRGVDEKHF